MKLGQVQVAKGSRDQAIATYQQALTDNPRAATFYVLLGDLYASSHDWNKAETAYKNALAMQPQNAVASSHLANVILYSGGDLNVAASLAETAFQRMPQSPDAADTLGRIY